MNIKHILLTVSLLLTINGCSRIVKEEPYIHAEQTAPLKKVDGLDLPQDTGQLAIPEVNGNYEPITLDTIRPPEMAFAKRRSNDENVVIIDADGVPTIEIYNDKDAWQLMNGNLGDNWYIVDSNEADCQLTLYYDDPINQTVEDQGFFKKLFTFESNYIDRSGQYVLTCLKLPQKQQIWVQTLDYKSPSAFVVDDLFNQLFSAAVSEEG
ncbi:MAG: hypothetical protein OQK49_05100 [Proteobacteria bacterium]|nr:hypothetical protein [Pseudomonadota bacterium]